MDVIGSPRSPVANSASSSRSNPNPVDSIAAARNVPPKDRDGDSDNGVGQSNVTLSNASLRLNSTSVTAAINNQTQIPDQEKAKEVLTTVTEQIRNNPSQAQLAASSSSGDEGKRLAERLLAA